MGWSRVKPGSCVKACLCPALLVKKERTAEEEAELEEHAALSVLHRWCEMNEFISGAIALVPEHVEIRSLTIGSNLGLPQVITHMHTHTSTQISPSVPGVFAVPGLPPHVAGHVSH